MTVRELGDLVIWLGAVAGALGALIVVARYLIVRPLKKWIVTVIQPMIDQLIPNGGNQDSTRELIEQTAERTVALAASLDEVRSIAGENREIATAALSLARETSERLDRHMIHGHHLPHEGVDNP